MSALFAIILFLLAIFLILLVLVQRGRGGGLAGALGGMGGSSAFGAKAGDVFTRITIITAAIWIGISIIAFFWAKNRGDALGRADDSPLRSGPVEPKSGGAPPASGDAAKTTTLPPTATQAIEENDKTETPPAATDVTRPEAEEFTPPADAEKK
jgi:preprotein translocase subunit SecG